MPKALPIDSDSLDDWFPRQSAPELPALESAPASKRLGVIVGGSLSKGLDVKLDRQTEIESLAVGRYVVVRGKYKRFFCMITDVILDSTNPSLRSDPPDLSDPFLREVYVGTAAYGTLHVAPMLSIEGEAGEPKPVKTIPGHFMPVEIADAQDVNDVFGAEDETHFNIGTPLELEETQVNLDLKRLVERSSGVFGKSGTGKSFLTRILLSGVIQRNIAVNLIFDMHNDYGWEVTDERGPKAKGLRQLFPAKVSIFTLDEESSRRRNAKYDYVVTLGYDDIEPEDLAMLKLTMGLSDPMLDAAYTLRKKWGKAWIKTLLEADNDKFEEVVQTTNVSSASLTALARRLERFERFEFLKPDGALSDSVQMLLNYLTEQRKSVVLEFGRYGSALEAYILVANYLTRRIHAEYVKRVEKSLGDASLEPPQLLITIEEAHKFLDPLIARQTIFGTIAREMRKYNVTLLIVDQRPSGIDEEVMSQIGTRITALLDNERDIAAVLTGISGASGLREVLARLDTKQQALIMGHAVPMPVVVKTRAYDTAFYQDVAGLSEAPTAESSAARRLSGLGKRRIE
ncbi:MAG: ATPase [Candidatus Thermofonsia Clade 1 bacterium]|uniref:ATPase n=1 Tax=Candidatus Thermofonsia Clade 1 bacterium TaxID=2364210 RepID=A0A2M8PFE3_9CHLR|nr:MAG: ATPase [Candidatus Thermofonsia Clade 1 bacterium]RMF53782.1 MAG: ATP-binding protein [Chloroflexota bacterium]